MPCKCVECSHALLVSEFSDFTLLKASLQPPVFAAESHATSMVQRQVVWKHPASQEIDASRNWLEAPSVLDT